MYFFKLEKFCDMDFGWTKMMRERKKYLHLCHKDDKDIGLEQHKSEYIMKEFLGDE